MQPCVRESAVIARAQAFAFGFLFFFLGSAPPPNSVPPHPASCSSPFASPVDSGRLQVPRTELYKGGSFLPFGKDGSSSFPFHVLPLFETPADLPL